AQGPEVDTLAAGLADGDRARAGAVAGAAEGRAVHVAADQADGGGEARAVDQIDDPAGASRHARDREELAADEINVVRIGCGGAGDPDREGGEPTDLGAEELTVGSALDQEALLVGLAIDPAAEHIEPTQLRGAVAQGDRRAGRVERLE